jgi:hypothetical protein
MPAKIPPASFFSEALGAQGVIATAEPRIRATLKASADFHPADRPDTHQTFGQVRLQFVEDGLAQSRPGIV